MSLTSCCVCNIGLFILATVIMSFLYRKFFEKNVKAATSFLKYFGPAGRVDPASKRTGGDLVAQVLKAHEVSHVFTLVGGHVSSILVESKNLGIKVIDVRHEATSVFAADAFSRVSGKVGVAVVTAGPGVTNCVTALKNAQMAESPLILIGGAAASLLKGRGSLQDIEQIELLKTVCKKTFDISAVRDIIPTLRKAIYEAQSGVPGPVFVEIPIDCLYPYELVARESGVKNAKGLMGFITQSLIKLNLRHVFGDAFVQRDLSPIKLLDSSNQAIQFAEKTFELLKQAKKPVVIVGSQAMLPPYPKTAVPEYLNNCGIPCYLGGMARGALGKNSALHMRHHRKEALKEADFVILAGAICDFRLSYGKVLPKNVPIVTVNRDPQKNKLNSGLFWNPTLKVDSDVASFLHALSDKCTKEKYKCDPEWIKQLRKRDDEREIDIAKKAEEETKMHLNPIKVLKAIDELLPENSIIVADGGDFVGTAAYTLKPRGPLGWLDPGAFGTLGVGGGFAIGAKCASPDSQVWVIYGDGSAGYSIMEYDTMVRHKIPVISIVGNDACWNQIAREQIPLFNSSVACDLAYSNYEQVSSAMGGKGMLVKRENFSQMIPFIKSIQEELNKKESGNSVLINVLIGSTNFRDGSISV